MNSPSQSSSAPESSGASRPGGVGAYLASTRRPFYSLTLCLPLLVLYEGLVLYGGTAQGDLRNAGDVWLRALLQAFGLSAHQAFLAMLFGLMIAIPFTYPASRPVRPRYWLFMALEAWMYSLALGVGLGAVLAAVSVAPPALGLWLAGPLGGEEARMTARLLSQSLGAGLFEELVFRVMIVGGLAWAFSRWTHRKAAMALAVGLGALAFSLAHYLGPEAYRFDWYGFWFRLLAGVVFSVLYWHRGFGVTACTHALYDLQVMLGG
ncbi:MAG: CPBP family intramembrane metalloprotease [Deltaproteobacteria bacterium]|nr:CPBP family intramembrane metalloprotease [Deltaproteobacteria bacterium]